jgi:DNA-binding response OmpR family regulator
MIKICVVDDNPLIVTTVKRALSALGYSISVANNLKEFSVLSEKEDFDLVITDYYLQDSTALDIKNRLSNKENPASILVMTGKDLSSDFGLPLIKKPFSVKELREVVQNILAQRIGGKLGS